MDSSSFLRCHTLSIDRSPSYSPVPLLPTSIPSPIQCVPKIRLVLSFSDLLRLVSSLLVEEEEEGEKGEVGKEEVEEVEEKVEEVSTTDDLFLIYLSPCSRLRTFVQYSDNVSRFTLSYHEPHRINTTLTSPHQFKPYKIPILNVLNTFLT